MQSLIQQFIEFCRSKPADEAYNFIDADICAFAQFGDHIGADFRGKSIPVALLEPILADGQADSWTFGALAERLSA